jgi:hypothetical protein
MFLFGQRIYFCGQVSREGIQKRHIIHSGQIHILAEFSRGETCPLSNGHHFSFALPTDIIINAHFLVFILP